jgi:hypothetical protein
MTFNDFYRKLGFSVPQNPIARDSHMFQVLAERTRESDAELRSQRTANSGVQRSTSSLKRSIDNSKSLKPD